MKCTVCKEPAVVKFSAHNSKLCAVHFDQFFLRQVQKTIKRFVMLQPGDQVMVALSGGKDSITVADVLYRMNYSVTGFHLDLGIEANSFSEISRRITETFCAERNIPLVLVSVKEQFGRTILEAGPRFGRFCSFCGMTKRYLMNATARQHAMNALATGHNLDDQTTVLLANLIRWQDRYLPKGVPCLPPDTGFTRKIKPLAFLTSQEITAYVTLKQLPVVTESCPHARKAKFTRYTEALHMIEEQSPGTKRAFYKGYLKNISRFQKNSEALPPLKECSVCTMPTILDVCNFCTQWRRS